MRRRNITGAGVIIAAMALILTLAVACDTGGGGKKNSAAELTKITVAGEGWAVDLGSTEIPAGTAQEDWDGLDDIGLLSMESGTVLLNDRANMTGAVITVNASGGSKVFFTAAYTKPDEADFSYKSGDSIDFQSGEALYVKVTSEDGSQTNYYRFTIQVSSAVTTLAGVTVTAGDDEVGAVAGTPQNAWDAITAPGSVNMRISQVTNAVTITARTANAGASVEYAYVAPDGDAEPVFGAANSFTVADGGLLYIKVTAENGVDVAFYKIEVQIGRDATLASVAIGETEQDSDQYLGVPADSWRIGQRDQSVTRPPYPIIGALGTFQTDPWDSDINHEFPITITANDADATVEWVVRVETRTSSATDEPTDFAEYAASAKPTRVFGDESGEHLYIRVTAANRETVLYYKMVIVVPMSGVIKYGMPDLDDPDNASNKEYVDPIWEDEEWAFDISRVNKAEPYDEWFEEEWGQHTFGKAKALWDDDGIWVYLDVEFKDYKESENAASKTREAGLGATDTSSAHNYDSLEVFVNERLAYMIGPPPAEGNNWGVQFRSSPDSFISGDAGGTGMVSSAIDTYRSSGKYRTWLKADNAGYVIITQVPWMLGPNGSGSAPSKTQAAAIWNEDGTIKDNAVVGFELQLNACAKGGHRDGILTWNGINSQAYQNARGYGRVTLVMDGRSRQVNAAPPIITAQPASNVYATGDTIGAISVTATSPDSGTLSYQWYDKDGVISAATEATYTPTDSAVGKYTYYVVVTNTNEEVNGKTTATATSATATIFIRASNDDPEPFSEKIEVTADVVVPLYGFVIPADDKLGNYTKITASINNTTHASNRFRVWGTFPLSSWTSTTVPNIQNAASGLLLVSGSADDVDAFSEWKSYELVFNKDATYNTSPVSPGAWNDDATGVIIFAIGVIGQGGNNDARDYEIKDIVLSNEDGSKTIPALNPKDNLLWDGEGAGAFARASGQTGTLTRTLDE